jgi:hypothetical protein
MELPSLSLSPGDKWLAVYLVAAYLNALGSAALTTIFGPSQPYLAARVDVHIDSVNWLWTFYGLAGLTGYVCSSFTFKQYVRRPAHKMAVMAFCQVFFGTLIFFFVTLARSFPTAVALAMIMRLVGSYGDGGEAGMYVYTMGPDRSRPWIMIMHTIVGVGFSIGPFIVGRYFPNDDDDGGKNYQSVCFGGNSSDVSNSTATAAAAEVDLESPWRELGAMAALFGLLYLIPILLPWPMPVHEDFAAELEGGGKAKDVFPPTPRKWLTLTLIVVYYATICGNERLFQSMQFTFGLCGPLRLSPLDAVFTDKMYNVGFTLGRVVAVFATLVLTPQVMVSAATAAIVGSSVGIAALAGVSRDVYYALTFVFGFSISWQYGSMYSFLAKHMDLVVSQWNVGTMECSFVR